MADRGKMLNKGRNQMEKTEEKLFHEMVIGNEQVLNKYGDQIETMLTERIKDISREDR
ncbi:MAG: hypothetical protein NC409_06315 [Clostridium sp.]|nr:hypothetical protein [Clostridium sp.]